jgi:ribosome-associated translation inhibitor RaiA
MQIQINTDSNIEGYTGLTSHVRNTVDDALSRFKEQITRIEVHLSDENSNKKETKDDMRCMMEARLAGKEPLAVSHTAATTHQAVDGALDKLTRLLDSTLGKQRDLRRRQTRPATGIQDNSESDT